MVVMTGGLTGLRVFVLYLCCSLTVVVEDVSSSCCVAVKVFPYMTVAALKQQVRKELNNQHGDKQITP